MPPDFYAALARDIGNIREDFRQLRNENREDHGKIFDRLSEVEKSNHPQPCETLKGHVQEHKDTRKTVLNLAVKSLPWALAVICAGAAWAQKYGIKLLP